MALPGAAPAATARTEKVAATRVLRNRKIALSMCLDGAGRETGLTRKDERPRAGPFEWT